MKDLITIVLFGVNSFMFLGCGTDASAVKGRGKSEVDNSGKTFAGNDLTAEYLTVQGYITPIGIVVNGKPFSDSEDFFTQELSRLKVDTASKYPNYTLAFDANIGLSDFVNGFSAFLVPSGDAGVASQTAVDGTGKLTFNLPPDTEKQVQYTVDVSKRINMLLTSDTTSISWCYNFTGHNQIFLDGKPFVIKTFKTAITTYQCGDDTGNILSVPDSSSNPYNYVTEAFVNGVYHGYGPLPQTKDAAATNSSSTPTAAPATGIGSQRQ